MKNPGSYLTVISLLILVSACTNGNNIKEILKDKSQRQKIIHEISSDRALSKTIISQLLESNRIKKQIADNPKMFKILNTDKYHRNCPSGKYIKFYDDGTLKETGTFRRFKFCDTLRRFHSNGAIEYEAIFNDKGQEQGEVKYYYPNGQQEFVYYTKNGLPHGEATRYCENGDIKETTYYNSEGIIMRLVRHQKSCIVEDPELSLLYRVGL